MGFPAFPHLQRVADRRVQPASAVCQRQLLLGWAGHIQAGAPFVLRVSRRALLKCLKPPPKSAGGSCSPTEISPTTRPDESSTVRPASCGSWASAIKCHLMRQTARNGAGSLPLLVGECHERQHPELGHCLSFEKRFTSVQVLKCNHFIRGLAGEPVCLSKTATPIESPESSERRRSTEMLSKGEAPWLSSTTAKWSPRPTTWRRRSAS